MNFRVDYRESQMIASREAIGILIEKPLQKIICLLLNVIKPCSCNFPSLK